MQTTPAVRLTPNLFGIAFGFAGLAGHVVSILGWGSHSLAPLSFRGATYSGVFTLLPLLSGRNRAHHGAVLAEATLLAEAGLLTPRLHPSAYDWHSVADAHSTVADGRTQGKVVISLDAAPHIALGPDDAPHIALSPDDAPHIALSPDGGPR